MIMMILMHQYQILTTIREKIPRKPDTINRKITQKLKKENLQKTAFKRFQEIKSAQKQLSEIGTLDTFFLQLMVFD